MSFNRTEAIIVAMPFPSTGGGYRALLSIKEYWKRGINPRLVLPWGFQYNSLKERREITTFLLNELISKLFKLLFPGFLYEVS
jgi:hypothetical protein